MSLRNLSFVQIFEQFDTNTQFNILRTLMGKMEFVEVKLIDEMKTKIKNAATKKWKFPTKHNDPYDSLQPEFYSSNWKDWEGVFEAWHTAGYNVVISACFIGENLDETFNGFTAGLENEKLGLKTLDITGQKNILDIFKKDEQELRALFGDSTQS